MKTENQPFKAKGKFMIYHNDRVFILTTKGERDRLIERLNFAYQKGYDEAMKEVTDHSNKILERFGV